MVSEDSTSSVMVFPVRVCTKPKPTNGSRSNPASCPLRLRYTTRNDVTMQQTSKIIQFTKSFHLWTHLHEDLHLGSLIGCSNRIKRSGYSNFDMLRLLRGNAHLLTFTLVSVTALVPVLVYGSYFGPTEDEKLRRSVRHGCLTCPQPSLSLPDACILTGRYRERVTAASNAFLRS